MLPATSSKDRDRHQSQSTQQGRRRPLRWQQKINLDQFQLHRATARPAAGELPNGAREGPLTVWVYVITSKQVGDKDHLKVFADEDAAESWFGENDP